MSLKILAEPAQEPVSLFELKDNLRLDHDSHTEDNDLQEKLKAARRDCELFQNRAYITQTWELWLDAWPGDYIEIPVPPLQQPAVTAGSFVTGTVYRILSVGTTNFTLIGAGANTVGTVFTATGSGSGTGTATASCIVKYYGTDDTENILAGSVYAVDDKDQYQPKLYLKYGQSWPGTALRPYNGICVSFAAGYGDDGYDVPQNVRQAISLLAGHYYENREATTSGQPVAELPLGVKSLLWKERVL